jgi:hypothetical protein
MAVDALPVAKGGEGAPARPARGAKARAAKGPVIEAQAEAASEEPAAAPPAQPAPAATQEPTNASGENEIGFNREAARQALEDAGQRAASCRTVDTPAGPARVAVTFAPSGTVTSAVVESGPLVGTSAGGCVAAKIRGIHVPAFTGDPVTVRKSVAF